MDRTGKLNKENALFIHPQLYVKDVKNKGRGVFTKHPINPMETIEISSVLVMSPLEKELLNKTLLHDYIFDWGSDGKDCCVALGYLSIYNHGLPSNCEYFMDYDQQIMSIKTITRIEADEELTVNYNGTYDNDASLWFTPI